MSKLNPEKYWTDSATKALVGRKIVKVQYMTKDNAKESDWFQRPLFLILDDGSFLFPQSDDEGNDGGALGHVAPDEKLNEDGYYHQPIYPVLRAH
ncbi:hypothetical protein N9E34_03635 [Opitutales bacterium]|nr:hypothetical protein [Opitutales bacterium]